ncbi:MAG: DinB family protein [Dehalococcoidia bacterium]
MSERVPEGPERQDRDRVRSYIVGQAERYEPADYWPRVMELRVRLLRLLDEMTPGQAAWRPPTGEGEDAWSAIEIAQHLRQWSDNIVDITRAFVDGHEGRKLPSGYIDPDPEASLVEVRRALIEASQRLGDALLNDAGRADPERTVEHSWFGPLTARQWFVMARVHDTDHIRQIEGLQQMPGFPAADR